MDVVVQPQAAWRLKATFSPLLSSYLLFGLASAADEVIVKSETGFFI